MGRTVRVFEGRKGARKQEKMGQNSCGGEGGRKERRIEVKMDGEEFMCVFRVCKGGMDGEKKRSMVKSVGVRVFVS